MDKRSHNFEENECSQVHNPVETGSDAGTNEKPQTRHITEIVDSPNGSGPQYLEGTRLAIVIICLYFATFLAAIDTSMITASVPRISTDLHSLTDVSWISAAYTLSMTAFQPAFSKLYKLFQVEVVYISTIIIFELGTVLCASAHSGTQFIFGRAIAGLGAAGLTQGALCIITHTVEHGKRPLYNGIVTSVFGLAICFGPIMGGALTTKASWRWCFWINLPIGAICVGTILAFLRVSATQKDSPRLLSFRQKLAKIDIFGTATFVSAVCCILLALQFGGQAHPWNSATIIGLLIGGGLLLITFGYLQVCQGPEALLPVHVLKERDIWTSFCTLGLLGSANIVVCFYVPFYFQVVQCVDSMASGIRFIAYFLPLMVAVVLAGMLVSRLGYYVQLLIIGELIMICGCVCLMQLKVSTKTVEWAAFLVITGLGMGIAQQLPYTSVQVALSDNDIPIGNGIILFSWLMGGAIAVAIGQSISLNTIRSELPKLTHEISPSTAFAVGVYGVQGLDLSPAALAALKQSWMLALTRTFTFSAGAISLAVPITACMRWKNSRKEAMRRQQQQSLNESIPALKQPEQRLPETT